MSDCVERKQNRRLDGYLGLIWAFAAAVAFLVVAGGASPAGAGEAPVLAVPILLYHRFGPVVADSTTVTTPVLESHLAYLRDHGYRVIPLRSLVDYLRHRGAPPPPRAVVITVDDAHKSVFTVLLPIVKRYQIPVTVFVYPSAISNAWYAMTWDELRALKDTGLFDIESHAYWHPNFKVEKKRLAPAEYDAFVRMQFNKPRDVIRARLGVVPDLLAWPFGIYDDELIRDAAAAGYVAAFALGRRPATANDNLMALPRFPITDQVRIKALAAILRTADGGRAFARDPATLP